MYINSYDPTLSGLQILYACNKIEEGSKKHENWLT